MATYAKESEAFMSNIVHVQQVSAWNTLESSPTPVLVDFWAEWCGPCRMLAPTLDKLAKEFGNGMNFAKVNVDELPELASRFGIRSIPTLLLFREGKIVERLVGVRSYEELAGLLDRHVNQPSR